METEVKDGSYKVNDEVISFLKQIRDYTNDRLSKAYNTKIAEWHQGDYTCTLAEHLGMSHEEYVKWVESEGN